MNEAYRLAAWLKANAKHMKFEGERLEMIKAAQMLRMLEDDRIASLEALYKAQQTLSEVRGLINELPKQEALGDSPRISVPTLWC
jgi:hypothetical protein